MPEQQPWFKRKHIQKRSVKEHTRFYNAVQTIIPMSLTAE